MGNKRIILIFVILMILVSFLVYAASVNLIQDSGFEWNNGNWTEVESNGGYANDSNTTYSQAGSASGETSTTLSSGTSYAKLNQLVNLSIQELNITNGLSRYVLHQANASTGAKDCYLNITSNNSRQLIYFYNLGTTSPTGIPGSKYYITLTNPTWQNWTQYQRNFWTDWNITAGFSDLENISSVTMACDGNYSAGYCGPALGIPDCSVGDNNRTKCEECSICDFSYTGCTGAADCSIWNGMQTECETASPVCNWEAIMEVCEPAIAPCGDASDEAQCIYLEEIGCTSAGTCMGLPGTCDGLATEGDCNGCGGTFMCDAWTAEQIYGEMFFWDELYLNYNPDSINPIASFGNFPPDVYNSSSTSFTFGASCSDNTEVDYIIIYTNTSGLWQVNQTNSSAYNATEWNVTIDGISDGTWKWGVYCNDSVGNEDWTDSNRTFIMDSSAPVITIVSPTNTTYAVDDQWFNVTTDETALSCNYSYDGAANASLSGSGTSFYVMKSNMDNGIHSVQYYCSDQVSNLGQTSIRYFTIDDIGPTAEFGNFPPDVYNSSSTSFTFGASCSDNSEVDYIIIYTNTSGTWEINQTNSTPYNATEWNITIGVSDGGYAWAVWCNDTAGNEDWTDTKRTFLVDTTAPELVLITPQNTTYGISQWFNITASETISDVVWCGYSLDETPNITMTQDGLNWYELNSSMTEGLHSNVFYCNNSVGLFNIINTIYFTTDSTNPTAIFGTNPVDTYNTTEPIISFESKCTDNMDVDYIQIYADYSTQINGPGWKIIATNASPYNDTLWNVTRIGMDMGTWNWAVWCNDSVGNEDWTDSNRTFTIDREPIAYQGTNPIDNYNSSSSSITFDLKCDDNQDPNYLQLWTNTTGVWHANQTNISAFNETWWNQSVTGIPDGYFVWGVYCNDSFGFEDFSQNRTFLVDANSISPITSFGTNPVDDLLTYEHELTFEASCSDNVNVHTIQIYTNTTGTWQVNQTNSSVYNDTLWQVSIPNIPDGNFTWAIWCNDSVGNEDWTDTNRSFNIYTDAGHMLLLLDTTDSIPSGWTCLSCTVGSDFSGKFIRGYTTYGGDGGSNTNVHTYSLTMSPPSASNGLNETSGNYYRPSYLHSHYWNQQAISSVDIKPPYRQMNVIMRNDPGVPSEIPQNAIAFFNNSNIPDGWTLYSDEDTYFIRGNSTESIIGGSTTHSHLVWASFWELVNSTLPRDAGSAVYINFYDHDHGTNNASTTTSTSNHLPLHAELILAKANSDIIIPAEIITMWTELPAQGWYHMSNSSGILYEQYIRANDTYQTSLGSATHTHSNTQVVTSGSDTGLRESESGSYLASYGHTHTVSWTSFSTENNLPTYRNVIFAQYLESGGTLNVTFENPTPGNNTRKISNYEIINVSVDANNNVDICLIEIDVNSSGSGTNYSMTKDGSGMNVFCNYTLSSIDGHNYTYKIFANDSTNLANLSEIRYFEENAIPTQVQLWKPDEINYTTNRTPAFYWNVSSDSDGDSLNYEFNATAVCNSAGCDSSDNKLIDLITNLNLTLPSSEQFKNLWSAGDYDDYYEWYIRAYDGYEYSTYSSSRTIYINSSVALAFAVSSIDFGSLGNGESNDTEDDNPAPLVINNKGNCYVDVNLTSTDLLWDFVTEPSEFFKYKIANYSTWKSFNYSSSQITWTPVNTIQETPLKLFNYSDGNDSAEIDIYVEVPDNESSGDKGAVIVMTGYYVYDP